MALQLSTEYTGETFPSQADLRKLAKQAGDALQALENGTGAGAQMRGWLHHANGFLQSAEYKRIVETANELRKTTQALLVIGIGGSYLGARAVIEAVRSQYANQLPGAYPVFFAGNTMSAAEYANIGALLEGKDFAINIISKSGQTLEPAVAFRHFYAKLRANCGGDAAQIRRRVVVTTDSETGDLLAQAKANDWKRFVVPGDIGGRFSVLSAVGLLPIACAGVDIAQLLGGAAAAEEAYTSAGAKLEENPCLYYAALRYYYYAIECKSVELFAFYEPSMAMFGEWLKQLFGESEGKEKKGLFPASVVFCTDLHSLGQYVQDGERILFETVVGFQNDPNNITVEIDDPGDPLYFVQGKQISDINATICRATSMAHAAGDCPTLMLQADARDAVSIGWLIYFFEKACAVSGYMIGVNPFDQPGIESYKNNMYALLGKAGKQYDKIRAALQDAYQI
ncbi:MAG: glucose-6-phosphate isomerase [Oscillospiraceae bacterium]|nr:glucose-6-phosphate isomerase [Oscillospiraceae bacterium]